MGLIVTDGEMMMICSSGVQESPATPIKRVPGVPDGVGTSLPCKSTNVHKLATGNSFFSLPKCKVVFVRWYLTCKVVPYKKNTSRK